MKFSVINFVSDVFKGTIEVDQKRPLLMYSKTEFLDDFDEKGDL